VTDPFICEEGLSTFRPREEFTSDTGANAHERSGATAVVVVDGLSLFEFEVEVELEAPTVVDEPVCARGVLDPEHP